MGLRLPPDATVATDSGEDPTTGATSQEELADYKELRSLYGPSATVRVLDQFAVWLFASTAIVGALGAGFGVTGLNHLHGTGKGLFVAAVVSLSVSLAFAAFARTPFRVRVNRYQLGDLRAAHEKVATVRFWLLSIAAVLFALALMLAGLAPAFST
jgi:hypothetical protein